MSLPQIDAAFLLDFLIGLLNTPSPTGLAEPGIAFTEQALSAFPQLRLSRNRKGTLLGVWEGRASDTPRALTAHVDTLGAMVKEIKEDGRLRLTQLGGYTWNSVEGEGCTIFTSQGAKIRGVILIETASAHIFSRQVVAETRREDSTMEVRLDARTTNPQETRALGIEVGDFVALDPRVEVVDDFVRSRHLDDKACVACIVTAVKALCDAGLSPQQTTYLHISNFEETGHGAATGIPPEVAELLVVDMAAVGKGQTSDEFHASLCVKDSNGPYHHEFSQRLRQLADQNNIPYKVDIYPFYGSDGGAFWKAGGDVAVGLIGPGVDASHSYERTHLEALLATTQWIVAYLLS